MGPRSHPQRSLKPQQLFLSHRLRLVESQLLSLARKYGAATVADLDALVTSGKLREVDAFEDYFQFDRLEAERDALADALKELA